jgi:hypothetical protein
MEAWGTYFVTFLLGVATGGAGNYLAFKYTDRRRDSEKSKREKDTFKKIIGQMPELIAEMKADFTKKENSFVREFFVLPHDKIPCNSQEPRFCYYENEHHNLKGKIAILENHGYIIDVPISDTPIYRLTEEFWNLVLNS